MIKSNIGPASLESYLFVFLLHFITLTLNDINDILIATTSLFFGHDIITINSSLLFKFSFGKKYKSNNKLISKKELNYSKFIKSKIFVIKSKFTY